MVGLAALAGGASVTFQDLRSRSVELALHNAAVNGWGDRAQGQAVDWQSPPPQTFYWIIASDVLYHEALDQPLLDFLCRALASASRSTVSDVSQLQDVNIRDSIWIGDPGRRQAHAFIDRAERIFNVLLFDHSGIRIDEPQQGQYQLIILTPR